MKNVFTIEARLGLKVLSPTQPRNAILYLKKGWSNNYSHLKPHSIIISHAIFHYLHNHYTYLGTIIKNPALAFIPNNGKKRLLTLTWFLMLKRQAPETSKKLAVCDGLLYEMQNVYKLFHNFKKLKITSVYPSFK